MQMLSLFRNALPVNVYRNGRSGDCSNNGVSKFNDTLIVALIDEDDIDPNQPSEIGGTPVMVWRQIGDHRYLVQLGQRRHSMFGGNFAYTCDSRFRRISDAPVAIHDRYED